MIIIKILTEIYTDTIKKYCMQLQTIYSTVFHFFLHIKMQIEKTLVFQNAYKYAHYR